MSHLHYAFQRTGEPILRNTLRLRNVASARYDGDWSSIPHTHNYTELFYIIAGTGAFRIDDEQFPVEPHQLVVVNPNVIHTEVGYDSKPLEYLVVGIEGLELPVREDSDGRYCVFTFHAPDKTLHCMQNILSEMQTRAVEYETACQAYMEILSVQLMREIRLSLVSDAGGAPMNRQCAAVRHYIDRHYKERLTLDVLAEVARGNKYYLAHAFKQEYGISPINYMIDCRIREARRLLTETDLLLSQIASILGFSSPSYFSQSFRRTVGISPQEFRTLSRENRADTSP